MRVEIKYKGSRFNRRCETRLILACETLLSSREPDDEEVSVSVVMIGETRFVTVYLFDSEKGDWVVAIRSLPLGQAIAKLDRLARKVTS